MLFNSYEFLLAYLPITVLGFFAFAVCSRMWAMLWLAAASVFFYGWWSPRYVFLMLGSIAANYLFGRGIGRSNRPLQKRRLFVCAITFNLALLAYYKYANFFISAVNSIGGGSLGTLDIILPIGISFFTFTQIAFIADVYAGKADEYDLTRYVLFVTFFPHLVAGPILHHKEMMPQFATPSTYRPQLDNVTIGMTIFTIGLAKKVLLADGYSEWTSPIFDSVETGFKPTFLVAWVGALAYTFQIYFDFSGYSDMAIGLSRLFGIKLPLNFESPYKALNIADFWRRWHMTLSRFLRDYLYIPLGGNRAGEARRYFNLLVTMLLGGLWHGANWTFVVWGGLHGLYLVAYHAWIGVFRPRSSDPTGPSSVRRFLSWAFTFLAVVAAWVFFRSATLSSAIEMLRGMAGLNGVRLPGLLLEMVPPLTPALEALGVVVDKGSAFMLDGRHTLANVAPLGLAVLLVLTLTVLRAPNTQQLMSRYEPALNVPTDPKRGLVLGWFTGSLTGILLVLCLMSLNKHTEFLYFQF